MDPAVEQDTARRMTARYVAALCVIALCTFAAFVLTTGVIDRHQDTLEVINVSGRQRMLSQRTALIVTLLQTETAAGRRAALLRDLEEATTAFEAAHRRLTGTGPEPALGHAIRELYFAGPDPLNDRVLRFIGALRAVLAAAPAGTPSAMAEVRHVTDEALGRLLLRLEEMVDRYQQDGEAGFRSLRDVGAAALALTLLTLVLEVVLIFRPMVRQATHQLAEIGRMAASLERTNEGLEAQVRARTAELSAAKEVAEQAHRAKSRFLAQASHDLKQPLQAAGMFTGMLERTVEQPRAQILLRDLRAAQRAMDELLTAILDLSRLESGVITPRLAEVPVGPILDRLAAEFAPLAAAKELRLSAPSCSATVRTDPALLERILRNFLSNAVRYTEKGGLLIGARRRRGLLLLEVHDTGRGIPEDDRQRIFEEFIQLDRPDRDRSEGIGLGLAIADRLARLLGHTLTVRSRPGGGSVFAVSVPVTASGAGCFHRSEDAGGDRMATQSQPAAPDTAATDKEKAAPAEKPRTRQDEAAPGTPGSGENIDPRTGERFIEGIGGG